MLGASLGTSIANDMRKKGLRINECRDWICNLGMLRLKRISGAFLLDSTAGYLLNSNQLEGIVRVEPPIVRKDYYLMISKDFMKKYPEYAHKIWDALKIVRATELHALSEKYFSKESQ